jgi:hypothetical protein
MAFLLTVYKNRKREYTISLYETDGTTSITLAVTDVVRLKIYRRDAATPVLDLDSAAASANGSVITVDQLGPSPVASVTATFDQADLLLLEPGVYSCEVDVVDDSDGDKILHANTGVIQVMPTGGGDIALA